MKQPLSTPAFVFSVLAARENATVVREAIGSERAGILYSLKACAQPELVSALIDVVDGLSVSSIFELALARSIGTTQLHWVSVAFQQGWMREVSNACAFVTVNSVPQLRRLGGGIADGASIGLRINPTFTVVDDTKFDPCRRWSKLGIQADTALWAFRSLCGVSGIHLHTACCSTSWEPLLRTVKVVERKLAPIMHKLEWINLGGGYQWDETSDFGPLQEAVDLLTNTYGLEVFLEPGDGIVNSAGSLHASVVDLFESDGKMVAILDTTVNHLPEVFEYQYEPDVAEHVDGAPHEYILAGCSCLAGDLFGEYAFEEPLDIGSRITFENVGAYSLVKANMFNGINLPSIYIEREDGELELVREFTYEDFLARCGGEAHAATRAGV